MITEQLFKITVKKYHYVKEQIVKEHAQLPSTILGIISMFGALNPPINRSLKSFTTPMNNEF